MAARRIRTLYTFVLLVVFRRRGAGCRSPRIGLVGIFRRTLGWPLSNRPLPRTCKHAPALVKQADQALFRQQSLMTLSTVAQLREGVSNRRSGRASAMFAWSTRLSDLERRPRCRAYAGHFLERSRLRNQVQGQHEPQPGRDTRDAASSVHSSHGNLTNSFLKGTLRFWERANRLPGTCGLKPGKQRFE